MTRHCDAEKYQPLLIGTQITLTEKTTEFCRPGTG
jgi:hypothetical protein